MRDEQIDSSLKFTRSMRDGETMLHRAGCAGFTRRDFLRIGSVGLSGLSLPALLRAEKEVNTHKSGAKAKNVIFIWQQGGPPHQDMWDMKPDAPEEVRGEFKPIQSDLPGYTVCELMPLLAKQVKK